jgi:hypothetical protein
MGSFDDVKRYIVIGTVVGMFLCAGRCIWKRGC